MTRRSSRKRAVKVLDKLGESPPPELDLSPDDVYAFMRQIELGNEKDDEERSVAIILEKMSHLDDPPPLVLRAKKLASLIRVPNDLLKFASPDVELMLREDMQGEQP